MTPTAHLVAAATASARLGDVMSGLPGRAALIGALLVLTTLAWGVARRRAGTFRTTRTAPDAAGPAAAATDDRHTLTAADLGHALGARATFVQFSTSTCATCPQVRRVLGDLAARTSGLTHVEVDAEHSMDLVRRLRVLRTPTVLLVGPDGVVLSRTSGPVTAAQAAAALDDIARSAPRRPLLPTPLQPTRSIDA